MDMQGKYRIPAKREMVWAALNDPEILKQAITGCESLDKTEDGGFEAVVKAKVGPVKATFKGVVRLENVNAPESYTIVGEGKGGAAGFAKGGADVSLAEDGEETILSYTVNAQVGGKLAQIGGRLIDSTAKKYATEFFNKFVDLVGTTNGNEEAIPSDTASPAASDTQSLSEDAIKAEASRAAQDAVDTQKAARQSGLTPTQWVLFVVVMLGALVYFFNNGGQ